MLNIFQGRKTKSIIEKLGCLDEINKFFNSKTDSQTDQKLQEQLDEIMNFLKLKEHLIDRGYQSFHIKIADNTYYNWTLEQRAKFLKAHSTDYLCKTIVMKNKKFKEEMQSEFYHQFVCVVVQYNSSLNNEKLIKVLKKYQNENCEENVSRKGFHYRLADEEENLRLSGYRHNAVTPFMLLENMPIIVSKEISELSPKYFWLGGGHENTKLRLSFKEFQEKSEHKVLVGDFINAKN